MTDQTAKTSTLAEALALLQGRLPEVKKTEKAQVGQFSYDYAGLAAVSRDLLPIMSDLGLSFSSRPTLIDERFCLQYEILHASGESRTGVYPLPTNGTPQQVGSAITYARRYCLCAVTGLVAEADDDGAAASHQDRPAQRRTARKAAPPARPEQDDPALISPEQRKAIMAGFGELGIKDREQRMGITRRLAGVPDLASTSDLSKHQARLVLDGILDRRRQQTAEATP